MTLPQDDRAMLPCPFCGDPMRVAADTLRHVEQREDCPISVYAWGGPDAVDRWNRRTPDAQALAAAEQRGRMEGEWQDISTAPKDGTEVLLWGACWRDGQHYAPDRNVGWWTDGWHTRQIGEDIEPTRWHPLPAPPAIRNQEPDTE